MIKQWFNGCAKPSKSGSCTFKLVDHPFFFFVLFTFMRLPSSSPLWLASYVTFLLGCFFFPLYFFELILILCPDSLALLACIDKFITLVKTKYASIGILFVAISTIFVNCYFYFATMVVYFLVMIRQSHGHN